MLSRKILWAITLVGLCFLYLLTNTVGALCILVSAALAPILGMAMAFWQAHSLQMTVSLPGEGVVDVPVKGTVRLQNGCPIPAGNLIASIECRNAFIGAHDRTPMAFSAGRGVSTIPFEVTSDCCGNLAVTMEDIGLYDVFGIMRFRIADTQPGIVRIVPETVDIQVAVGANADSAFESDRYSMELSGGDPAETFALREYVPGDALRSIHWKLSEKTDRLIVRELGLPILNDVLVVFENVRIEPCEVLSPRKAHAMASAFISISRALVRADMGHTLCWTDRDGRLPILSEVHDERDCEDALGRFLDARIVTGECATPTNLVQTLGSCPFAHVVNITAAVQPDIATLHCGNVVTTIGFISDNDRYGGEMVITTSTQTYREDLAYLEI